MKPSWADNPLPKGFDAAYYYAANPDVAKAAKKIDGGLTVGFAENHYRRYGINENRALAPKIKNFNEKQYLKANKDVKKMGMDPTLHYHLYGQKENRPLYTQAYLDKIEAKKKAELARLQAEADRKERALGEGIKAYQRDQLRPSFGGIGSIMPRPRPAPPVSAPIMSAPQAPNTVGQVFQAMKAPASRGTLDSVKAQNRASRAAPQQLMAPPPAPRPMAQAPMPQQLIGAMNMQRPPAPGSAQAQLSIPVPRPNPMAKLGVEQLFDLYNMKG